MAAESPATGMNSRARMAWLPDGRLHLQDGPIDLIIRAEDDAGDSRVAYAAAMDRFSWRA